MITFDTGALIAIERRDRAMLAFFAELVEQRAKITIPTCVVGEWWRGQRGKLARILDAARIEPLTLPLAKLSGQVLAAVPGATLVDAIVVASAAQRGDLVVTSDRDDLGRIRDAMFPTVRLRGLSR
jgi:predicted nucleic acid-binding protein